jgi:hypothetical protein
MDRFGNTVLGVRMLIGWGATYVKGELDSGGKRAMPMIIWFWASIAAPIPIDF